MNVSLWQQTNGSVLNAVGVLIGALIGLFFRNALPPRIANTVQSAIGLTTLFLGMRIAWGSVILAFTASLESSLPWLPSPLAVGSAKRSTSMPGSAHLLLAYNSAWGRAMTKRFSEGLFAAFLIFCVRAVTILGSIDNGLRGDNQLLIIKTVIDTITAAALAESAMDSAWSYQQSHCYCSKGGFRWQREL
jgi:uncharacterized membrane protein YqgA involved in biofilm formation